MDQSDDMVSSDRESRLGQTSTKKPKTSQRIPKCTRCQNHGKKVQVKFHKRECEFRYCLCEDCILTTKRQQIMKVQTAQRRARQQHEMLMEMRKKTAKSNDSETPPAPSMNGNNDSNSSDMPSLSNNNSNSETCRSIGDLMPSIPLPQNLPPPLPHTTSPAVTLFESETNPRLVEELLGYSAKLLQRFGYHWQSLTLMYVILKDSRADVEVAMRRIAQANSEIQATAQFNATFGGYYRGGYYPPSAYSNSLANLGNLGNPTYFGQVPYVGLASPTDTTALGLLPYFGTHVVSPKVPSSPDSPPERPSSYPETSISHRFKIEKKEDTD
nr:doublesex M2 [Muscidifurax uniraptor]WCH76298.1 doublesex M2' [Muscidifurax uniraptor]